MITDADREFRRQVEYYLRSRRPEERSDFIEAVLDMFCQWCGGQHPKGRHCECWKDNEEVV